MKYSIGVDIGGTNVRVALCDDSGKMLASVKEAVSPARTVEAVVDQVATAVASVETKARVSLRAPGALAAFEAEGTPLPLGVGLAAFVDSKNGHVLHSPNLKWRDVPLAEIIGKRLKRRVHVVNDLNAITMGEAWLGAAAGKNDVVCVFVGTGVGMGALSNGRLVEGARGAAAELGHVNVNDSLDAPLCGCGARGCLEVYCGGVHLGRSASEIESGFESQDPESESQWQTVAGYLGRAIQSVAVLFDPSVIVLGGGVFDAAPNLARLTRECGLRLMPPAFKNTPIVFSSLGGDAGVLGAARIAMNAQLKP